MSDITEDEIVDLVYSVVKLYVKKKGYLSTPSKSDTKLILIAIGLILEANKKLEEK